MSFNLSTIKYFFILALLAVSCFISWGHFFKEYQQQDTVSIHEFPKSIGPWNSEEMTITDMEYAILETRNAFSRKYRTPAGQEVALFIVYSQNNRKVSHPPEVCYIGGGISVINKESVTIPGPQPDSDIAANKLLLEKGTSSYIAYYWFKVGDSFTPNYWKQQTLIAVKTLLGKPSSSALIRVSA